MGTSSTSRKRRRTSSIQSCEQFAFEFNHSARRVLSGDRNFQHRSLNSYVPDLEGTGEPCAIPRNVYVAHGNIVVSRFVERCSGRKSGAVMGGIHVTPTAFSGSPRGFVESKSFNG